MFQRLKLLARNCAKTHTIARTQKGRRIFDRIEKLQRSAANEIPPARRTQRINSRLRTADANRARRNFFSRHVATRRRQNLRQACQKCKTRNEPNAGHSVIVSAVKLDDFTLGKLCVFSYTSQIASKFGVITDRNFGETRSPR